MRHCVAIVKQNDIRKLLLVMCRAGIIDSIFDIGGGV